MSFDHLIKEGETWDNVPDSVSYLLWSAFDEGCELFAFVFSSKGDQIGAITKDAKTCQYSRWAYQPEKYTKEV